MKQLSLYAPEGGALTEEEIRRGLEEAAADELQHARRVLLLVPDITRFHSMAGLIANAYYHLFSRQGTVDVLPALGTHLPMTEEEIRDMYGDIPSDRFLVHNWRTEVVKLGQVPAEFVSRVSEGVYNEAIDVEINRHLLDGYDLILSIGQVVPHEVVGMANHTKNIFVGCGGSSMINSSHILGAFYGMERMMGRDRTPVRAVFDYAAEHYLTQLPICYVLTVTTAPQGEAQMHGLFIGPGRTGFEQAVALAQKTNMTTLPRAPKKIVVYLDPSEFCSTWLGNKSVYRTRLAIAGGGELVVLAPGVDKCGEDAENDRLIRKYGYCGRKKIIELCKTCPDLQENLSAAAHLIHGSSDGKFTITYCTRLLTQAEVEQVGYQYAPYEQMAQRYDPAVLKTGWNTMPDGEEIFYIPNPALGLWRTAD